MVGTSQIAKEGMKETIALKAVVLETLIDETVWVGSR